jgi:dTDP-4-amino-4,6-dideoxygalactose transaminase
MIAELPPVGNRVSTEVRLPLPEFRGYRPIWLASGTAALALSLLHAKLQHQQITRPEVIIPAYGCPDLVAAGVYAGVTPVLADVGHDDPALNPESLAQALSENTIAIIAVSFLGIRERIDHLRALLPSGVAVIEDNAQWFPESSESIQGDYAITSFGRGKPASTLGGGLLLVRDDLPLFPEWLYRNVSPARDTFTDWASHRGKVTLYNVLRQPVLYYWLNRLPFVTLGETRYKELDGIRGMPASCKSLVASNAAFHLGFDRWREKEYQNRLGDFAGIKCLSSHHEERSGRLLRFPVLCGSRAERDALLEDLKSRGLGASAMYRDALPAIPGVRERIKLRASVGGAETFAQRLLTLPLHSGVTQRHIASMAEVFRHRLTHRQHAGTVQANVQV